MSGCCVHARLPGLGIGLPHVGQPGSASRPLFSGSSLPIQNSQEGTGRAMDGGVQTLLG